MKTSFQIKFNFNSIGDQFRNLDPSDVGAWPIAPRAAVLLLAFILTLVAGWIFIASDELETLNTRGVEEQKLKSDYLEKVQQSKNLAAYKTQLEEIDRVFGTLLKQLPDRSDVEQLLQDITNSALARGLQIEVIRPGQEVSKEFYAELPITLRITGNYHDFGYFAEDIAKFPRIVTLNNISISPNPQNKEVLVMDAVAKTFRYLQDKEIAQRKGAKK